MRDFIKKAATEIGFDACGIARAESLDEDAAFLRQWLSEGQNASMHYLERNFEKRTDPTILVPGSKSVVVVLLNYYNINLQPADAPRIARYAYSETDYHTVIREMLGQLEQRIVETYGSVVVNPAHQHSFVDSAPILERRWAQKAGLGWIGKNTQLIAEGIGSYCFIGILLLNKETEYDQPVRERCGSCTRCLQACPTKALNGKSLDARLCISYQTIENKEPIEPNTAKALSNRVLGCDICAEVCPWNKKWAQPHTHQQLKPVDKLKEWTRENWLLLDKQEFKTTFKASAIQRAGFEKLIQNIQLANEHN